MKTTVALIIAEVIAAEAHYGQTEKDGGPYIAHVERVVARLSTDAERAVAWLHDVVEDSPLTAADLLGEGLPEAVVEAVEALTRSPLETYTHYIERVRTHPDPVVRAVKVADLQDHLRPESTYPLPRTLRRRYEQALALLTNTQAV